MRIIIPAAPTRTNSSMHLNERISKWMWDNGVEHWLSYRVDYYHWAVEFVGLDSEADAIAFKLKFSI